jgi:hypothetical protein
VKQQQVESYFYANTEQTGVNLAQASEGLQQLEKPALVDVQKGFGRPDLGLARRRGLRLVEDYGAPSSIGPLSRVHQFENQPKNKVEDDIYLIAGNWNAQGSALSLAQENLQRGSGTQLVGISREKYDFVSTLSQKNIQDSFIGITPVQGIASAQLVTPLQITTPIQDITQIREQIPKLTPITDITPLPDMPTQMFPPWRISRRAISQAGGAFWPSLGSGAGGYGPGGFRNYNFIETFQMGKMLSDPFGALGKAFM